MDKFSFLVGFSRKAKPESHFRQVALLAILALCAGCKPAAPAAPPDSDLLALGAETFDLNCAQCHYDGLGSETMPALKGSSALAGSADQAIKIILYGQRGISQVNGRTLGGIMPPQSYLSNSEIAAIVTYIRAEFSDGGAAVSEAEVEALR